jgi:ATP-binding cassette, subfamily B, bacterial
MKIYKGFEAKMKMNINNTDKEKIKNKIKNTLKNYSFIFHTMWKASPHYFIILILITIIGSFLPLVSMFIMKNIIDLIVYGVKDSKIFIHLILLLALSGISIFAIEIIKQMKDFLNNLIANRVGKNIIYLIQKKASQLDLKFYDTPEYYNKLEDTKRVIGRRWDIMLSIPVELASEIVTLVTFILILGTCNVLLIPLIIVGVLPNIFIQLKIRKKEVQFYSNQIPESRKIFYTENILSAREFAKEVKLFGISDFIINLSQKLFNKQFNKIKKLKFWELKITSIWSLISAVTTLCCLMYISISAFNKIISIGNWQLYTQTSFSIYNKISTILYYLATGYEEDLYTNILNNFLETKPNINFSEGMDYPFKDIVPSIKFENVKFGYLNAKKNVLNGINFEIKPFEKIAIVGLNGAGKSTIIKLLTRLYDPDEGSIFYNNTDIKKINPESLYKQFSIVFQDYCRYAFSLKYNICISDLNKINDDNSMLKAAKMSGVDRISSNLLNRYETYLTKAYNSNGYTDLSTGEWQKIAISRAFFRDSQIVILDEPTSSLDPLAEYNIYKLFINLCKNKTTILISHRLTSIRIVDRIIFLKDGIIAEMGTHRELIEMNGEYSKLYRIQADQYNLPVYTNNY